jgi:hypothetical protein
VRAWTIIVFTAALQIALSILFHIDMFHSAYPGMEFNTMTGEFVPVNDSISSIDIYHNVDYLDSTRRNFPQTAFHSRLKRLHSSIQSECCSGWRKRR